MFALQQMFQMLLPLAQVKPQIFDNFDEDEIARMVPEMVDLPTKLLRPVEERYAVRAQAAQMQAAQMGLAGAQAGADVAKTAAEAEAAGARAR